MFPDSRFQILDINPFEEEMLPFDKRNTTGHPRVAYIQHRDLTTTTPNNSANGVDLEAGVAFNEKKMNFLYMF